MGNTSSHRTRAAPAQAPACRTALAVLGEELTAVGYVRFAQPFEHLREHGWRLATLGQSLTLTRSEDGYRPDPRLLDGASLLMVPQMVAAPRMSDGRQVHLVGPLCEAARRHGARIVYSADDHVMGIESGNPSFDTIHDAAGNLADVLEHADAILVTTDVLRRSLEPLGLPIHVLPNAIDPERWIDRPRAGGELRVGWAGSSSHVEDLLMVAPALVELRRRVPFRLVIYGLVDMPLDEQARAIREHRGDWSASQRETARAFLELHDALRGLDPLHVPFGPMASYFETLPALDLDLALCPLRDTAFNRHKSALKFYEYAVTGSLTVASDVAPYTGEVSVTCANDTCAWRDTLERWLRDPAARDREAAAQREHVLRTRDIRKLTGAWAAALDRVMEGR